jgi:hypothetical protein
LVIFLQIFFKSAFWFISKINLTLAFIPKCILCHNIKCIKRHTYCILFTKFVFLFSTMNNF